MTKSDEQDYFGALEEAQKSLHAIESKNLHDLDVLEEEILMLRHVIGVVIECLLSKKVPS